MSENDTQGTQDKADQQFSIQKVFMKDMSFESPNVPAIFTEDWKPDINLQLNTNTSSVTEGVFEVILSVTVTARLGDRTAYLVEVQQGGVFTLTGFEPGQLGHMLGAFCPNLLYPFAREAVADLIGKGGFPPVYLSPINFDALYAQKLHDMQAQVETAEGEGAVQ